MLLQLQFLNNTIFYTPVVDCSFYSFRGTVYLEPNTAAQIPMRNIREAAAWSLLQERIRQLNPALPPCGCGRATATATAAALPS